MKLHSIAAIAISCATLAPAALADGRQAGSKLVFPIHRSGPTFFTVLSVTNTDTRPATPANSGGSTNVHFEYYNVVPNETFDYAGVVDTVDYFNPRECIVFDRKEFLTPADTMSVLTGCHNAFAPGGQEGFVVVTAEDPNKFDVDWVHNYLIGSELVINGSGAVYSLNAFSVDAIGPRGAAVGTPGGHTTLAVCDGVFYDRLPQSLFIDTFIAEGSPHLTLISAQEQPTDQREILFSVWNDNEFPLSATLRFKCWFDQRLADVNPLFQESFLSSTPNDPEELDLNCDGNQNVETGWACIETRAIRQPGGDLRTEDFGMIGAITSGPSTTIDGGRLLWEKPTLHTPQPDPDPDGDDGEQTD